MSEWLYVPLAEINIFFINGLFKSLKSINLNTEAVFNINSTGVKNPNARIPEINPLNATPIKTTGKRLNTSLKITERITIIIVSIKAKMIDTTTMSILRSILRTIIEAETHDADMIFVTHDHFDHFSPADIAKVKKEDTVIVAPESIKENQGYRQVRSEMPKAANIIMGSLQVICGVGVFFCVVGSVLAKQAAKDRNNMDFAGASYDKLKGLKIGAIAAIPGALLWAVALILRLMPKVAFTDTYYWVYRWVIMCPVKPIIDIFTNYF